MRNPPAFQFYADDFIGGTVTMTHEERGLYILLLCLQWTQGSISPDDAARLGSTLVKPSLNRVLTKFQPDCDGLLKNRRLEAERDKQIAFRERQARAGEASAKARFNRGSTVVQPEGQPKLNSPSPSPSPSPNKKEEVASLPLPAIPEKEKPKCYHEHARVALHWLNEKSGKHFRETDANLARISARLNEQGVDIEGVKQMIDRQCALWKPDAKMSEYLRPETLFGKEKFDNYYAARLVEFKPQWQPQFVDSRNIKPPPGSPEFCPGWKNKDWREMTKKELDVYVDQ
jgi:uncharacterized phage protein (TIGR02220 family)